MRSLKRAAWPWLVLMLSVFMTAAGAEENVCIENATIDDLKSALAADRERFRI